ncbi:MAG: hypothetical protein K8S24_09070, partial [Candidatus Aegiribacteria sp.]|nr:hypothetical protein [Candidatus Aegiribacteria sp.]
DFLLEILELLDKASMNRGRHTIDPYEFEIRMLRKAIGWPLPILMKFLGFSKRSLHTRGDLDEFAGKLSERIKI